jgi:hypothetical protein
MVQAIDSEHVWIVPGKRHGATEQNSLSDRIATLAVWIVLGTHELSGAGFPGIALKILAAVMHVASMESNHNKNEWMCTTLSA